MVASSKTEDNKGGGYRSYFLDEERETGVPGSDEVPFRQEVLFGRHCREKGHVVINTRHSLNHVTVILSRQPTCPLA